jgi:hypothetical protein
MKINKYVFAFALALGAGYGANEAQAMIKTRCVDTACMQQCQAAGESRCLALCATSCD